MEEVTTKKIEQMNPKPPVLFAPNRWRQIRKFRRFHRPTYQLNWCAESALSGADEHFEKYLIFKRICERLIPELSKDYEELTEKGHTEAIYSRELAAIVDSLFCELYSSVDCTRTVLGTIYKKYQGITSNSTSRLFKNASENKIDERVPYEIRKALEDGQNDWFPTLKHIRDAINHSSIGSCSDLEGRRNGEIEPKIAYFHDRLGSKNGNILVTDDVFKMISEYEKKVNMFLGFVYHALNQTLENKETTQTCGVFNHRFYQRSVSPYEALNFHSGRCLSREWFEKEDQPTCPYVDICGAYIKSKNTES